MVHYWSHNKRNAGKRSDVITSARSALVIEETIRGKPGKLVGVIKDSLGEYFVNVLKRCSGTGRPEFRLKCGL